MVFPYGEDAEKINLRLVCLYLMGMGAECHSHAVAVAVRVCDDQLQLISHYRHSNVMERDLSTATFGCGIAALEPAKRILGISAL